MEKLPLFDSFKSFWLKAKEQIKKALVNKDFGWLIAYFTVCIFICLLMILGALSLFHSAFPSKTTGQSIAVDAYKPPALKLTYQESGFTKDESGLYHTRFTISVNRPPGNFQEKFRIIPRILNAKCSDLVWKSTGTMDSGGVASTTANYEVECTSYVPIIDPDTKNLFILEN